MLVTDAKAVMVTKRVTAVVAFTFVKGTSRRALLVHLPCVR